MEADAKLGEGTACTMRALCLTVLVVLLLLVPREALAAIADDGSSPISATMSVGDYYLDANGLIADDASVVSVTVPSSLQLRVGPNGVLQGASSKLPAMVNVGARDAWVSGWTVLDAAGRLGQADRQAAVTGPAGSWWLGVSANGGAQHSLSVSQGAAGAGPLDESWVLPAGDALSLAAEGFVNGLPEDSVQASVQWQLGFQGHDSTSVDDSTVVDRPLGIVRECSVTFDLNLPGSAGSGYAVQVERGSVVTRPIDDPTAQDADGAPLTFAGWCVDPQGRERWDFSQPVEDDLTLYASWLNGFAYAVEVDGSQLWFVRAGDLYQAAERALSVSGGFEMTAVYGPGSYYNPNGDPGLDFERHAWAGRPLDDAFPAYGAVEVPWLQDGAASEIERVVFADEVAPASCAGWFSGMDAIAGIEGLDLLNTTHAVSLRSLFEGCSGLERIDLAGWDTSRVRDMALMFSGCSALTDLRVGNGWTAAGAGNLLAEFPRAMQDDTGSVWKAGAVVPDGAAGYQALADDASTAQVDERLRAVRR